MQRDVICGSITSPSLTAQAVPVLNSFCVDWQASTQTPSDGLLRQSSGAGSIMLNLPKHAMAPIQLCIGWCLYICSGNDALHDLAVKLYYNGHRGGQVASARHDGVARGQCGALAARQGACCGSIGETNRIRSRDA